MPVLLPEVGRSVRSERIATAAEIVSVAGIRSQPGVQERDLGATAKRRRCLNGDLRPGRIAMNVAMTDLRQGATTDPFDVTTTAPSVVKMTALFVVWMIAR